MAELLPCCGQVSGQPGKGFGAVSHTAGIVGRIDQHGGGVFVHQGIQRIKVDLEILHPGRRHPQRQTGTLHIGLVLRKKRRKGHDVLSRHRHAAHRVGQRPRCTGRHKDMVGGVVHAEPAVQAFGHFGPHFRQGQGRRIAVQRHRVGAFQQVQAGLGKLSRAGHRRIAQRIVKYVFVTDFLAAGGAPFGNFPNNRLCPQHIFIVLCYHRSISPLLDFVEVRLLSLQRK